MLNRKQSNVAAAVIMGLLKVQLMEFSTCTGTEFILPFCMLFLNCVKCDSWNFCNLLHVDLICIDRNTCS